MLVRAVPRPPCGSMAATARPPTVGGRPLNYALDAMSASPVYVFLHPDAPLPDLDAVSPFRALLVLEQRVSPEWQALVSAWLVRSGCLYMMAWGVECSSWDDSVDVANIAAFLPAEIPEDRFVMTTWHENEPLSEAFWFCKYSANHPSVDLHQTFLVQIAPVPKQDLLLASYAGV